MGSGKKAVEGKHKEENGIQERTVIEPPACQGKDCHPPIIDKTSLWLGLNIQKKELCVEGILTTRSWVCLRAF